MVSGNYMSNYLFATMTLKSQFEDKLIKKSPVFTINTR